MITFKDVNESFIKIEYSNDTEFTTLFDFFSVDIPGVEYTDRYKAGLTDGKKHFLTAGGMLLYGLKQKAINCCIMNEIEYQDITSPIENDFDRKEFAEFYKKLNLPFTPYKHQLKGVILSLQKKRGVIVSCTGSGKSLIIAILAIYSTWKGMNTMLIVPRIDLVNQMYEDFQEYFYSKENKIKKELENETDDLKKAFLKEELNIIYRNRKDIGIERIEDVMHKIYGGQDKHIDKPIKISTRDSLSLNQGRVDPEYFHNIDMLLADEVHQAGSVTTSDIVKECQSARYKLGFTGSLGNDTITNLIIEGLVGEAHKIISMRELIDLGLATNVLIKPLYLKYNLDLTKQVKKMKWQEEDKFIRNFVPRNKFLAQLATSMRDKNVMIIYKNIDAAESITKEIVNILAPDKEFKMKDYQKDNDLKVYVSKGDTKAIERNGFRGLLEKSTGNILLGTLSIISTGINIKNLHCFIFSGIGKKDTLTIQAVGRLVRLHESKDNAIIYDAVDDLRYYTKSGREYPNYNFKHWNERLNTYITEEFEVQEPINVQLDIKSDDLF